MTRFYFIYLLLVGVLLTGCTPWTEFIDTLNERQLNSCVKYTGQGQGFVVVHGVTATGGANVMECMKAFQGQLE